MVGGALSCFLPPITPQQDWSQGIVISGARGDWGELAVRGEGAAGCGQQTSGWEQATQRIPAERKTFRGGEGLRQIQRWG